MLLRSFLVIEDEKDTTYRTRYVELFPPINSMISVHCFQCLSVSLIG